MATAREYIAQAEAAQAAGDTEKAQRIYAALAKRGLQVPTQPVESDRAGALAHGAGQGASLGFSDEIYGAAKGWWNRGRAQRDGQQAPSWGDAYAAPRDAYRDKLSRLQESNPAAYGAGEIGGGLASLAIPGGAAVRAGASPLGKAAGLVGVNALEGGAAGLGYSDADDPANLGVDAGVGAGIGAGVGMLAPAWGPVSRGVRAIWDAGTQTPAQRAGRVVGDILNSSTRTVDETVDAIRDQGGRGRLFDIDDPLMGAAGVAKQRSDEGAALINEAIDQRQKTARKEAISILSEAANIKSPVKRLADTERKLGALQPRISEAYRTAVDERMVPNSPHLATLLETPIGKQYRREVTKNWQSTNPGAPDPFTGDMIPMRVLDGLKRQLEAGAKSAGVPGATPSHKQGSARAIQGVRDQMVGEVDSLNPDWKDARALAQRKIKAEEALEYGRTGVPRGSWQKIAEAEEKLRQMDPRQKVLFREGLATNMIEKDLSMGGKKTGDIAAKLYDTADATEVADIAGRRLGLLATSKEAAEKATDRFSNERRFNEVQRYLKDTTGTRTPIQLAAGDRADDSVSALAHGVRAAAQPVDAALSALTSINPNRIDAETATEMAKILATEGAEAQIAMVRKLMADRRLPQDMGDAIQQSIERGNAAAVLQALTRPVQDYMAQ